MLVVIDCSVFKGHLGKVCFYMSNIPQLRLVHLRMNITKRHLVRWKKAAISLHT